MKTWRTIAAALAAFALATALGCNADTAKDNNSAQEPAVQDEGQSGAGASETPANGPMPDVESGDGEGQGTGQGAQPSSDAGGTTSSNPGGTTSNDGGADPADQPIGLPTPIEEPAEPQPDGPGGGVSGNEGDDTVSILPVIEPEPQMEIMPVVPEPTESRVIPPDAPQSGGGADPNTPVSKRAAAP